MVQFSVFFNFFFLKAQWVEGFILRCLLCNYSAVTFHTFSPVQLKDVCKETNRTTIKPPLSHYSGCCTIVENMWYFYLLGLYLCFTNWKSVFACHQLVWSLHCSLFFLANFMSYVTFFQPSMRYHCTYGDRLKNGVHGKLHFHTPCAEWIGISDMIKSNLDHRKEAVFANKMFCTLTTGHYASWKPGTAFQQKHLSHCSAQQTTFGFVLQALI